MDLVKHDGNGNIVQYPYNRLMFRRDHQNVLLPSKVTDEMLAEYNVAPVEFVVPDQWSHINPESSDYYLRTPDTPVLVNGKWQLIAEAVKLTPEQSAKRIEKKSISVRFERDNRLKACDWTQLPDAPLSTLKKTEWATYRQALRDLTKQAGFPYEVTYPEEPK